MSFPSSAPSPDTQKLYPLYLCLLCFMLYISALGMRDFWAPVEPRYAEIARVMFSKNEWIVPTINGDLYTDKPILYFWLALISAQNFRRRQRMDGALARCIGRRGVRFGNLLDRTRFSQRPCGINWRGGACYQHASALGSALGACRHGVLRFFRLCRLLWRALAFPQRPAARDIVHLPVS